MPRLLLLLLALPLLTVCRAQNEIQAPDEIVRLALEAQARGDVDAMASYFALDHFGDQAAATALDRLRSISGGRSFLNFSFQHLATSGGNEGSLCAVRAEVYFELVLNGEPYPVTQGVMAILKSTESGWKILWISSDEVHELALAETEFPEYGPESKSLARLAGGDVQSYGDLDIRITEAMRRNQFNEKAVLDGVMSAVGQVPVIGDSVAITYGVADTLADVGDAVKEGWTYGMSGLMPLKVRKIGLGLIQVFAEPVPFLDATADGIAMLDDQIIYNLEIKRALAELRIRLKNAGHGKLALNPRLFLLKQLTEWDYPAGMDVAPDSSVQHSYGTPIAQIAFDTPDALGRRIPFRAVGELELAADYPAARFGLELGGVKRGETWYIPVDATHLISADASEGDFVLDHYGRYRTADGSLRLVSWDATCRRGRQKLAVSVRTGEKTPAVLVLNRFMNGITELRVDGFTGDALRMDPGGVKGPFQVIGVNPSIEPRFHPELVPQGLCFDTRIADPGIAGLTRGQTLSVTAKNPGKTVWEMLLAGSAEMPEYGDVTRTIPVEVIGQPQGPALVSVEVYLSGTAIDLKGATSQLSTTTGTPKKTQTCENWSARKGEPSPYASSACYGGDNLALEWSGNTFHYDSGTASYRARFDSTTYGNTITVEETYRGNVSFSGELDRQHGILKSFTFKGVAHREQQVVAGKAFPDTMPVIGDETLEFTLSDVPDSKRTCTPEREQCQIEVNAPSFDAAGYLKNWRYVRKDTRGGRIDIDFNQTMKSLSQISIAFRTVPR